MKNFLDLVLGTFPLYWYAAAFFFASLGLFLRWAWRTNKGIKNNPESPSKFSWAYWIENNLKAKLISYFTTVIVVFVTLRFFFDWFGSIPLMSTAFAIGLCIDWVVDFIKNKSQKPLV